jgi:hypothetical protein
MWWAPLQPSARVEADWLGAKFKYGFSLQVQEQQRRCLTSHPLLTQGAPQPRFWRRVEPHLLQVGLSLGVLS